MAANNLQFTEHDWDFIRQAVASGAYQSESEVLLAGLRLLEAEQDQYSVPLAVAQRLVAQGFAELDRGEYVEVALEDVRAFLDEIEDELDEESGA